MATATAPAGCGLRRRVVWKPQEEHAATAVWEDDCDGAAAVAPRSSTTASTAVAAALGASLSSPRSGVAAATARAAGPTSTSASASPPPQWGMPASAAGRWRAELPQDLAVLVCQCLGPREAVNLLATSRRMRDVALCEEVWRFFCRWRWAGSANLHIYRSARDLYCDRNGWFPFRQGRRETPTFNTQHVKLRESPSLTMDLRFNDDEVIAVSEAERSRVGGRQASVHVVDPATCRTRERFEVTSATINCVDCGPGLLCLGSNDSKVRLYRRSASSDLGEVRRAPPSGSFALYDDDRYRLAAEFTCMSEVNDLRLTREDAIIAVRTHEHRHPAGLDVIPIERPDVRLSFPGGSWPTCGKFIHALDGFEEGCSLSSIACSGEHPATSAFSAMLFDFRRSRPCVADLPVTSLLKDHPVGTMLWPLRAGTAPKVYAHVLQTQGRRHPGGTIAMIDFRYPTPERCVTFDLPDPVEDFRCFAGSIYALCSQSCSGGQKLSVNRLSPGTAAAGGATAECIGSVVEAYRDDGGAQPSPSEDLKVFSVCSRGFAVSYREHLTLGAVAAPSWRPAPSAA